MIVRPVSTSSDNTVSTSSTSTPSSGPRVRVTAAIVKAMLRRENTLRLSPEYQMRYGGFVYYFAERIYLIPFFPVLPVIIAPLKSHGMLLMHMIIAACVSSPSDLKVTDDIQRQVAREFGFEDEVVGVEVIRTAISTYPNDPEIRSIPHYVKYNRARQGDLKVGDITPDVPLHHMDGRPCRLSEMLSDTLPTVVIGGSYS
jgi:hypothetical protein